MISKYQFFYFNTKIEIQVKNQVRDYDLELKAIFERMENTFSFFSEFSMLNKLNQTKNFLVSEEFKYVLEKSIAYTTLFPNYYDPTWGFKNLLDY